MKKVLLVIGDAAEVLDTMYPLFRIREDGYQVLVAAPERREYHLVQHDTDPDWDITIESRGYKLAADIAFRDIRPEDYAGLVLSGGRAPEYLRYDRDLIDVFIIQDEISNAIANELKVSLTTQQLVKAPTTHFAAYEAVLQGRYHFYRFDPADQAKALAHFERAIAIDPAYAAAHIGIALNHWGQMVVGMADPREAMQRSVAAAREALLLDPANSEGHHILASYYALRDFDWVKAEFHFGRALELNPHSLWAYHCKTIYLLFPLGRLEEAVECQDRALAIDPLTPAVLANLALALEGLHREQEEAQVIDRVTQMDPNFVGGQWSLVRFRIRQGRIAEAVELAERLVQNAGRWGMTLGALGAAYAAAGKADAAREVIAELGLDHNRESRAFYSFLIAAALDDRDEAFRWAAESIEHRDPIMLSFLWNSSFDKLRGDQRFAGLLRTLRIEDRKLASAGPVV